jgi:beta-phosphoglucomutase family hydrolase
MDYTNYAFIFDMDGTLVDNMHFHTEAWRELLAERGMQVDAHEFLVRTAGKTNREVVPEIFGEISDDEIEHISNLKESKYRELFLPHRRLVSGAQQFIERSTQLGIRLAVATAAPPENVEFIIDGLELRNHFDAIVTAADVKRGKPDPEIFLKSAERVGVAPTRCMVFEDALGGFEAAYRAGMKSVGIATVNPLESIMRLEGVIASSIDFTPFTPERLIEEHLDSSEAVGNVG